MKKISKLLNSPITWKQSFIAAAIGMILSLIVIVVECVSWNKKVSKSFKEWETNTKKHK